MVVVVVVVISNSKVEAARKAAPKDVAWKALKALQPAAKRKPAAKARHVGGRKFVARRQGLFEKVLGSEGRLMLGGAVAEDAIDSEESPAEDEDEDEDVSAAGAMRIRRAPLGRSAPRRLLLL